MALRGWRGHGAHPRSSAHEGSSILASSGGHLRPHQGGHLAPGGASTAKPVGGALRLRRAISWRKWRSLSLTAFFLACVRAARRLPGVARKGLTPAALAAALAGLRKQPPSSSKEKDSAHLKRPGACSSWRGWRLGIPGAAGPSAVPQ